MEAVDLPEMADAWSHPSARLLRLRLSEVAGPGCLIALVAGLAAGSAQPAAGIGVGLGVLLVSALASLFVYRRFRAWGYQERSDDLLVTRGVLVRRLSVVPYGRMQFVDVTAGPLERLAGLATVRLHTAAATSDARIPGLEPVEAARLRDALAALGEAKAAGL